ncbi:MAG: formylglycine-generating enzyme family protein [Treponemataceae bacterium]|nr:formylglycine-generating enzyme family protein [Treponemataceae bacterium]
MNIKVCPFVKFSFFAVVMPLFIVLNFFSCNNGITDNTKNNPSNPPVVNKVVTITGTFRHDAQFVVPNAERSSSRSALPKFAYSDYDDDDYYVTATPDGVSTPISGAVSASEKTFSIQLTLGKAWTITLGLKNEDGETILKGTYVYDHTLAESDIANQIPQIVLKPSMTENGTGDIHLDYTGNTAGLYDRVSVSLYDSAQATAWNPQTVTWNTGGISATGIKSGRYSVSIDFFKDDVLVYSIPQEISVFNNMTTAKWVGDSQTTPITSDGTFVLSQNDINSFKYTNLFVSASGDDTYDGSQYYPLASVAEALHHIVVKGAGEAYTIWLMSDISENIDIAETLNSKAASITIKSFSGNKIISGVPGVKNSVLNITTTVPVTLENMKVTGGTYDSGYGIYSGGTLKVRGKIIVTGNTRGSGSDAKPGNVYLPSGKSIAVIGALDANSRIGVTTQTKPTNGSPLAFTSGFGAGSGLTSNSSTMREIFTSDEGYVVLAGTDTDEGEATLAASGGNITDAFVYDVALSCTATTVTPGDIFTVTADVTKNGTAVSPAPVAENITWGFELLCNGRVVKTIPATAINPMAGNAWFSLPLSVPIYGGVSYALHAVATYKGVSYDAEFELAGSVPSSSSSVPAGFVAVAGATISGQIGTGDTASAVFKDGRTFTIPNLLVCNHEVTQSEFVAVMENNTSCFNGSSGKEPSGGDTQSNRPVERVSWYKTLVYCNKRSIFEGLTPCYTINGSMDPAAWGEVPESNNATWNAVVCDFNADGYRLPTIVEWEYVARGGNGLTGTQFIYSGSNTASDVAWYGAGQNGSTHEVKKKAANGLGIFDMGGNVWEWCWDRCCDWDSSAATYERYARGGNFSRGDGHCKLSYIGYDDNPFSHGNGDGFRVVRTTKMPVQLSSGTDGTAGTTATYMYFGEFPQTIIASGVTVDESVSKVIGAFTYYYGSDGAWYVKQKEYAHAADYTYSDGTTVAQGGTSYKYFKVEPVKWRVLTTNYNGTGKKLLLAENILYNIYFYNSGQDHGSSVNITVHANNYEHSRIRAYLNGIKYDINVECKDFVGKGFVQTAFTSSVQDQIVNTTVMVGSDAIANNKVFLLSTEEASSSDYGFNVAGSGIRHTTDFARATGDNLKGISGSWQTADNIGAWWLRSPGSANGQARYVNENGGAGQQQNVHNTGIGVVPAICIDN